MSASVSLAMTACCVSLLKVPRRRVKLIQGIIAPSRAEIDLRAISNLERTEDSGQSSCPLSGKPSKNERHQHPRASRPSSPESFAAAGLRSAPLVRRYVPDENLH